MHVLGMHHNTKLNSQALLSTRRLLNFEFQSESISKTVMHVLGMHHNTKLNSQALLSTRRLLNFEFQSESISKTLKSNEKSNENYKKGSKIHENCVQ